MIFNKTCIQFPFNKNHQSLGLFIKQQLSTQLMIVNLKGEFASIPILAVLQFSICSVNYQLFDHLRGYLRVERRLHLK